MPGISVSQEAVNRAVHHAPFHFVGIRAVPAVPPSGPAFPLSVSPDVFPQFWGVLAEAMAYWPEAVDFEVCGTNTTIAKGEQNPMHPRPDAMPATAIHMQTPATVLPFRIEP